MMKAIAGLFLILSVIIAAPMTFAQTATVDHLTQTQLLEAAGKLEQAASHEGSASAKLAEYPNHFTMIALRKKNGVAEIHQQYADIFFVLRGQATLVSGGAVVDPKTIRPGEIQGTSVKDGSNIALHEGDIVHIPSGLPHQLLLPGNNSADFVYFVIKVREQ
jgi:mannose-6-phosphate isomerase-like protein (cupin superfamily)